MIIRYFPPFLPPTLFPSSISSCLLPYTPLGSQMGDGDTVRRRQARRSRSAWRPLERRNRRVRRHDHVPLLLCVLNHTYIHIHTTTTIICCSYYMLYYNMLISFFIFRRSLIIERTLMIDCRYIIIDFYRFVINLLIIIANE